VQSTGGRIYIQDVTIEVLDKNRVGRVLEKLPEAELALSETFFGLALLRNVTGDPLDGSGRTELVPDDGEMMVCSDRRAIFAYPSQLDGHQLFVRLGENVLQFVPIVLVNQLLPQLRIGIVIIRSVSRYLCDDGTHILKARVLPQSIPIDDIPRVLCEKTEPLFTAAALFTGMFQRSQHDADRMSE